VPLGDALAPASEGARHAPGDQRVCQSLPIIVSGSSRDQPVRGDAAAHRQCGFRACTATRTHRLPACSPGMLRSVSRSDGTALHEVIAQSVHPLLPHLSPCVPDRA
jgi:hypothetical protein